MGAVKRVVVKVQEIVSTAKTFKWKEFKAYRGGVLLVIARAIFELKFLVSFAIATIAVANNTRKAADEAHCRMAMQAANTAPATSLRVFGQLLKVGANKLSSGADDAASNMDITYCLAEKEARLTHGWDLNDWKADLPLFVLIGLVVATHIVAFVLILRQAIKEKPMDGTEGDAAFCFALNRGYNSLMARRARNFTIYLTYLGLGLLSVVGFARGTFVQLMQGRFFELYALIHSTTNVFASNEELANQNVEWAVLKPRVAGRFEWPDLLKSAPSLLQEKFAKHAKEDELRDIKEASHLLQEEHSNNNSSDNAKEQKALM